MKHHPFSKCSVIVGLSLLLFSTGFIFGQTDPAKGLKDHYKSYFPIGAAVTPQSVKGPEAALLVREFNSLTAENVMKIGRIHPEESQYNWAPADEIVNFALANGMKMRGHTLCWHRQTPAWLFKDAVGNEATKDVMLARLKAHITEVVTRYKGKIYAWDVVNEAIDDDSTKIMRNSPWYKICGDEYIAKAFQYAHEADPNALLFYNDYNTEKPSKRNNIYKLLKRLIEAKVPVHGVGLQGHWHLNDPSEKELRKTIEMFSSLGLEIQFTELDVSVYPAGGEREKLPEEGVFTADMEKQQIDQYKMFFRVFRDYKDKITNVTFWNISDKSSWLDNFPVRGRKNFPLLFDQELKPKKAYAAVVGFE